MSKRRVSSDALPSPRPEVSAALCAWFKGHARDLPWRHQRTGYRVWVSEVMLQQTRVSTVIPYFERFLTVFPTIEALASAEIEQVLALWSGLGYYRRARGLHEGARDVVARFHGKLPADVEQLRSIRGIGPYTAGAIASLAFGIQTPIVDGNVIRVLTRLYALRGDPRRAHLQQQIWSLAEALVPADEPGVFNEAMMELGATVCVPQNPLCLVCPLAVFCEAYRLGIAASLPEQVPQKKPTMVYAASLVARREGEVLLGRRRADSLFGGLWEPPTIEGASQEEAAASLQSFVHERVAAGEVRHVLSHREMHVTVFSGVPPSSPVYPPVYEEVRWIQEGELGSYGISTLAQKILTKARK